MARLFSLLTSVFLAATATAYPELVGRDAVTTAVHDVGEVDYIVVGGGVGGLALGVRLSEDPNIKVAVIEAGDYAVDADNINIPALKGTAIGTEYDWQFKTEPQEHLHNRSISWPRGKVLGGSGALNLMVWDRASDAEYDAIAQTVGSDAWNAEHIVEYMKKTENWQPVTQDQQELGVSVDSSRFGSGGPVSFGVSPVIPEHQNAWIPAMNALNVDTNGGSLSGNPIGVSWQPTNVLHTNYTRAYAAPAYYAPNQYRSNLKVLVNTTVTGIEWKDDSGNGLEAHGVNVLTQDNKTQFIKACNEVVLSAGSVGTPQLLELSGVGRKDVLEPLGIQVRKELLGVGENLHDHIRVTNAYELKDDYFSFDRVRYDQEYAAQQMEIYEANNGTLSYYDYTASGYAFLSIDQFAPELKENFVKLAQNVVDSSPDELNRGRNQQILDFVSRLNSSVPELEIIFSDGYSGTKTLEQRGDVNVVSLIAALMHPFSRGTIHINTTEPTAKPVINPNYFQDEYDVQMLTEFGKYMRRIFETEEFGKYFKDEYEPGYDLVKTDEDWMQWAYNTSGTVYHPVGTATMGPLDKQGVVDPNTLKVHGINNVRVADASIVPFIISGHIQTLIFAIAEKASELIKSGQ